MASAEPVDLAPSAAGAQPILRIEDLKTSFHTDAGIVRAVNGVTLTVREGQTLAGLPPLEWRVL